MIPEIKTERLHLRAFRDEDLDAICKNLNAPEINKMLLPIPYPYTQADGHSWLEFCRTADHAEHINWAIDDGSGLIGIIGGNDLKGETGFGYWLAETHWGKGLMSEAVKAVLDFIFENYPIETLKTGVFEENSGSQRILHKLGFEEAGKEMKTCAGWEDEPAPYLFMELARESYFARRLDRIAA
ncbi:GNAT family N-acetyltransferase [Flexibacterium corallicola]|uniref:GNAT family N-acetyltransferase n=1 Tax=Flexibacterium corallicola TaxID=3037259 RepID=UPI00286EBA76|nr:GNAT family N-acetyltransferase [Pseudovibrio sp. M1P-2-3]